MPTVKALPFSNPNGQWVSLGATIALTGDFTIECWVNRVVGPTGGNEGYKDAIISHSGTPGPSLNFYADQFRLYDGSTDQRIASATTPTGWEHCAIVRSGTSFSIYKNGVLDSSATGTNNSSATFNFTSIGLGDGAVYFADFYGLEEVRVWTVARTAAQIAGSYQYEIDPGSTGLIAYWKFNEADASTTATDSVAGTYNGTLQGTPTATRVAATAPLVAPFLRRRPADDAQDEPRVRRPRAPVPPAAAPDSPQPRTLRRRDDDAQEDRRSRRLFAPVPAQMVADQPWVRARRPQEDAPDEPRPRRHSDAIAALDVPVTIPDLALWLRGDGARTSAGNLTSVDDWSGNGRDVAAVGTLPFLASSINGKPGWQLTGGANYLANLAASLFASGDARTMFVVVKSATEVGGPLIENQRTSGVRATYFQGGSGYVAFAGGVYTHSIDGTGNATIAPGGIAGVPMIVEFSAAAAPAFLAMRINGVPQLISQSNPCDAETGVAGFAIGRWEAGTSSYIGEMDEAIAYRRDLTAAEKLTIRTYLALRYLIGIDVPTWRSRQWMDAIRSSWDIGEDTRARRVRLPPQPAVTPDNPPPRASTARARMLADESRVEPDPRARRSIAWPRGSIGITTDASTAAVDLTAIGTSDWRTWVGTAKPGDAIRKLTGGSQISDWSPFNGSVMSWSAGVEPNVVQWSDGDPVTAGSHSGILFTAATGGLTKGFIWTVPADLTPRTLHLYLDALPAAGASYANILATLSDGSADDGLVTTLVDGEWNVHITYVAARPGQTLTVYFVGATPSTEVRVRGLALAGPAVPNNMPFIRRLWQRLATWDTEEPRAAKRFAPIPPPVTPDSPPPRARQRREEEVVADPAACLARLVPQPAVAADDPPPRAPRRREEEPEGIISRVVRKMVPPAPAVVDNPPPRAGRSNWRVSWDTWEPLEIIWRAIRRRVFPGVVSPVLNAPLLAVFDDTELTVDFDDTTLTVEFDQ